MAGEARTTGIRLGIAARLVLLVLAATLPFLLLFALRAGERRDEAARDTWRATAARANDAADRVDGRLREVHAALAAVGRAVRPSAAATAVNDSVLLEVSQLLSPLGVVINVYDLSWRNVGTSLRPIPPKRQIDDLRRALLREIARTRRFAVGEPETLDPVTGPWGIAVGIPITAANGTQVGSAVAVMLADALASPLQRGTRGGAALADGGIISVIDRDGHVIARAPTADGFVGRSFAEHPLVRELQSGRDSLGVIEGLDGQRRAYAAAALEEAPWHVLVGTTPAVAEEAGRRLLLRELAVFAATIIAALALALVIGRRITGPVQRLALDARALAEGDFAHRSTVRASWEAGDLARALNQMAASVAHGRDELAAGEQRYRALFDLSPLPMWMTDRTTLRFVAVNDAATRQYGWTRDEFLGMTLMDVRPPEARDEFRQVVGREPESDSYRGRWMHWRKDGSRIVVDVSIRDVVLDGRSARLSVLVDVTEAVAAAAALERSREELRQTQKMEALGRFAGGIAHDFNNLLTGIIGYADLLLPDLPAGSETRHDVEQIRQAAGRAAALTQQILAFSRRQVMQPQVLDLTQVIAGMGGLLQRVIGDHIRVEVTGAGDLWPVTADPSQLEQVVMNLALNARDAMEGGGTLSITTRNVVIGTNDPAHPGIPPGEWVLLSVRDTGAGMSPEVQARIFEPFFTTKPRGKGTGLGLATAYGIVEQSLGRMRVESVSGVGSTLHVYLPRSADTEPVVTQATRTGAPPVTGGVILLAEDEPTVRAVAAEALGRLGYVVLVASDGPSALEAAERHQGRIDLLVTDVVMPGMPGPALAAELRLRRPDVRVLFTSGYADDDATMGGMRTAGVPFLAKPFSPAELARRVREVLAGPTS
ncbi:MAG: response regulator [Gemmatimonadetes bacterium]|nr:response regulator [Gemmatimonadota bacterium]